jgi:sodium-dependent dicarboxylate transporter 2/3/5
LIFFISLAVLWLTREPEFMPGWSQLFTDGFVTDASVAVTVGLALFAFPAELPNILCFKKPDTKAGPAPALLDWETVHKKMPWSVIIVLGGGFALADACKESGLSTVIGSSFHGLSDVPTWILVLAMIVITTGFTNVASNTATATIFLPILAELAVAIHVNPFYLMLPVTIATSLAFMLPVATPPNAMVFAYGDMKIIDMVKAGMGMNIICIGILLVAINTYGFAYFDLGTYPSWAPSNVNASLIASTTPLVEVVNVTGVGYL